MMYLWLCRKTLGRNLLRSDESLALVGFKFQVSSSRPCLYFIFRHRGGAVCALASYTDDILGCGGSDILSEVRGYLERRLGALRRSAPWSYLDGRLDNALCRLKKSRCVRANWENCAGRQPYRDQLSVFALLGLLRV